MSTWNYPEIGISEFKPLEKDKLYTSYLRYFLSRLQSMFKWSGLPDTIPQKWLENMLLVNGSCVWVKTPEDGLFVNKAAAGGDLDIYYIPRRVNIVNPYAIGLKEGVPYIREENCILMLNDTYSQGIMPLLEKYVSLLVESDLSQNIAVILSRATMILSSADEKTRQSAELFMKHLFEGKLDVIGETPFLVGNQDRPLSINQMTHANDTITQLIEFHQYIKASLYNDIGLQSNYNMKRESINSNESQLNEDQLHPLIDNMLAERREAVEKVNTMFGTDISVDFNSAWEVNEKQEEAEIDQIEAETKILENQAEKQPEEQPEEQPEKEEENEETN